MCTLQEESCDSVGTKVMRGSATSAAAIMHDDTTFWEELVELDRHTALVMIKLQAGDYEDSQNAHMAIPAMPVLTTWSDDAELQSMHRDKLIHRTSFASAVVARKVGRAEMIDVESARQAMVKEWATMHARVWDVAIVREKGDIIREAKAAGKTVQFGRVHGLGVEKNAELPDGHPNRKYKGRVVFLGNRVESGL